MGEDPLVIDAIGFSVLPIRLMLTDSMEKTLGMYEIIAKEIRHDLYSRGTPDDVRTELLFASLF